MENPSSFKIKLGESKLCFKNGIDIAGALPFLISRGKVLCKANEPEKQAFSIIDINVHIRNYF